MAEIPQEWFEMADLRRRRFENTVWVPLRSSERVEHNNGGEEIFAAGCVAFPPSKRVDAERLGWSDLGIIHDGGPYAFNDGRYKPCEVYQYRDGEDMGIDLVFDQYVSGGHNRVWHVNQDLILALRLLQEGDTWVRPEEDYVQVIRQRKDATGRVISIEIRSEFLRDYLAARGLSLRVAYYRQRIAICSNASHIDWPVDGLHEEKPHDRFSARIFEVDSEGGMFGSGVAVFHAWRTDVDSEEDVPVFGPESHNNTDGRSATYTRSGPKFYRVEGELWREEWIEPAERSERVRGDKPVELVSFVIDASGRRQTNSELNNEDIGRYLWFKPQVIPALASRRGGGHRWYTLNTGSVYCSPEFPTHFGLNRLGLVNAYAYDVAKLPLWQQRIWVGYNIPPDGAVSSELLDSQMKARPAATKAPEAALPTVLNHLDEAIQGWLGAPLFQKHEVVDEIVQSIDRFRALAPGGIFALAKDVARVTADRIDIATLRIVAVPPTGEKWGSLKSLEKAVGTLIPLEEARTMLTPLVGVYELRHGDAHLPSSKIDEGMRMVGIDAKAGPIDQGRQLLLSAVMALGKISDTINQRAG
jgi:hypothetical protein